MIKKIILATIVLMLAVSISLAAGPQGIHEPGTGLTNPDTKEAVQEIGQSLQAENETNDSASTPGIHEQGTGITNPEVKEAAQGTGQGNTGAVQPSEETEAPAQKTQPGFDAILALTGLIAVFFVASGRRN